MGLRQDRGQEGWERTSGVSWIRVGNRGLSLVVGFHVDGLAADRTRTVLKDKNLRMWLIWGANLQLELFSQTVQLDYKKLRGITKIFAAILKTVKNFMSWGKQWNSSSDCYAAPLQTQFVDLNNNITQQCYWNMKHSFFLGPTNYQYR